MLKAVANGTRQTLAVVLQINFTEMISHNLKQLE